jgi:hypothetical protein
MVLSGTIGIIANLATGQRWDKGLLGNLALGGLFHKLGQWWKGRSGAADKADPQGKPGTRDQPAAKDKPGTEEKPTEQEEQQRPKAVPRAKAAVVTRAEVLFDQINRLRRRLRNTENPTAAVEQRLHADAATADALIRRADAASTDAEVRQIEREVKTAEDKGYNREVDVLRDEAADWVEAARRRVDAVRGRIPRSVSEDQKPQVGELQTNMEKAQRSLDELVRDRGHATSLRQLEGIRDRATELVGRLDGLERINEDVLVSPMPATLGIRPRAAEAMRTIDQKGFDPLGDYNRGEPGKKTNHYDAARRESKGEVVSTKRDGTPHDHIRDLQNGRDAVWNAKEALLAEAENPRKDLTTRGKRLIQEKLEKAAGLLRRVDDFLGELGWPASRPHEVAREHGQWVGRADVPEMRSSASGRLTELTGALKKAESDIRIVVDPAEKANLRAARDTLQDDINAARSRLDAAQTEEQFNTVKAEIDKLEARWHQLRGDVALTNVPK